MRKKKELPTVKELSDMTGRTSPAQIEEPASEPGGSSPPDSTVDYEQTASADGTPSSRTAAASFGEQAKRYPGTFDGEEEDRSLTLRLPARVILQLEEQARRDNAPLHVVFLKALAAAGYYVGRREPMHRPHRRTSAYSDVARAIVLFSLLSR